MWRLQLDIMARSCKELSLDNDVLGAQREALFINGLVGLLYLKLLLLRCVSCTRSTTFYKALEANRTPI
jgi:hypothetical protein